MEAGESAGAHYPDSARTQPMFLAAIAFLVGDCAVQWLSVLPPLWPWAAIWATLSLLAASFKPSRWIAVLLLGVAWSWSHAAWRMAHDLPGDVTRLDVELIGEVSSLVEQESYGQRFQFDVHSMAGQADGALPKLRRVELTWYDAPSDTQSDIRSAPRPGERWRLQARLKPRQGYANPGGYDYEGQLFREGIGATGYVRDGQNQRLDEPGWRSPVLQARAFVAERLAESMSRSAPHSSPHASAHSSARASLAYLGIVQGLAVGETSRVEAEQWRVFANTGTTHLMAISGLHIAMVAMCMSWLAGSLARRLPLQRWRTNVVTWQAIAGMSAALIYAALAGFSVPTQRTLVMLCVYFGMRLRRRKLPVTQGFGLALLGVLSIDPFAPLAAGFWLSFGAVAAIMLSAAGRLVRPRRWSEYLRLQGAVTIGMLPLVASAFNGVSMVSPLVNLLAIPAFTFVIVPGVLIASALSAIHPLLSAPLLHGIGYLFDGVWPLLEWAANLPLAMWRIPQLSPWAMALLAMGCVLLIAPGVLFTRALGAVLCLPALLWHPARPQSGAFELALLDVGQGLSIAIHTAEHTLLYDAGPSFRSGRDTGELAVLPYLYSRGVRRLDALVASHGDADHIGGVQSVLTGMPTARVLAGPSVPPLFVRQETCRRGQSWRWDDVRFEILHPEELPSRAKDNDTSCVLRVSGAGGSAIVFGDIERASEALLVNENRIERSEIAIVPHHGSRTSSTAALIAATDARYALISAGAGNRWGFPKSDVVERWRGGGATVLTTMQSGAIVIAVEAGGVQAPREHRTAERRYWRR